MQCADWQRVSWAKVGWFNVNHILDYSTHFGFGCLHKFVAAAVVKVSVLASQFACLHLCMIAQLFSHRQYAFLVSPRLECRPWC